MPDSSEPPRPPHCAICREPIEGLRVGVRRGWRHPTCGPEGQIASFAELVRRESQHPLFRYLLNTRVPADIQAMILLEFNIARVKWS